MIINAGAVIHGFEITEIKNVSELNARYVRMRHVKTGADLIWMDNGAENKTFSIAFKTIPEDSTGVFHILEHSVLCGSENYSVKEPFVELLKSSLNTFLNAMTFPDKTMYPVSSRNEKDFINLSRVYLDAVFKPAILSNANIFYQEGWHYQLEEGSEPIINGVVFNEMKGAYSSVDRVIHQELCRQLFPDNCYGLSSGGDPVNIPELTYEKFIETYQRYYHPSNSYIFLDGDVPLEKILEIIDVEYLSGFEIEAKPVILELQQPVESREAVCSYEIGADEDTSDKSQMMMGRVICDWNDREQQLAAYALGDYLTGSNDSPLKKALLESGLAQDISMSIDDGIAQPIVYLHIRNTSYDKHEEINSVVIETARKLIADGLDRSSLEASLNRVEFQLRQGQEPMGLERAINALSSWLYGGDPLMYLTQDEVFCSLRKKLSGDYFEQILSEFLVERNSTATVWCLPSATLGEERRKAERERIDAVASAWSDDDRAQIMALNSALGQWQQTPDSKENVDKLPVLSLSDVDEKPSERVTVEDKCGDVIVLRHPADAKGITYYSLYFNAADFEREEFAPLSLMAKMIGDLPTKDHTVAELDREIKTHIGELKFGMANFSVEGQTQSAKTFFTVSCSVLDDKIDRSSEIITEVLTRTRFDAIEDIRKLIAQRYDSRRRAIIGEGHRYGMYRTLAPYSAEADLNELTGGYSFYEYIRGLESDQEGAEKFASFAAQAAQKLFCSSKVTLSVTSGVNISAEKLLSKLPEGKPSERQTISPVLPRKRAESLQVPAAVSFAVMGINVDAVGAEYRSELRLLAHIASFNYLWNSIRVQGGAYGAGMQAADSGNVFFYTYRDPNSSRSLEVFRKTADFIREFCLEGETLDKSIIGCISNLDPLCSVSDRSLMADSDWFRGVTYEQRCRRWSELLSASTKKILELCSVIDAMMEKASVCVIGGADILAQCVGEQLETLTY